MNHAFLRRLVAIGLAAAVLLPLVQMLLAALYFKVGSPWASVLNAKVNVFRWRTQTEPDEEEEDGGGGGGGGVEMKRSVSVKWSTGENSGQLGKEHPPGASHADLRVDEQSL